MGCDIHIYAEKLINGRWQKITGFKNRYDENSDEPYFGRNYELFAILAGVRNGSGFAGCDTGDPVIPISEPRGLPEDVSSDIKAESDELGVDGHSHSWLLISEILKANIGSSKIVKRGWVDLDAFKEFLENGHPGSWCGGVSGNGVRHISNDSMRKIAEGADPEKVLETQLISEVPFAKLLLSHDHSMDGVMDEVVAILFPDKKERLKALVSLSADPGPEGVNARARLEELRESARAEVEKREELAKKEAIRSLYTQVEWVSEGVDSYGEFLTGAIPQLMARSEASRVLMDGEAGRKDALANTAPDPNAYSDIRIVFWFDN
jgi:hypothetical protein